MNHCSIDIAFFERDTLAVARDLLGLTLSYNGTSGRIVETEAYKDDAASHAVTRPKQGAMLRETFGKVYIYFIYGMYHCLNFTTEKSGTGAVLIRAIEPLTDIEAMQRRRGVMPERNLTNGPGKLFIALGLDKKHHGEQVGQSIHLFRNGEVDFEIGTSPRIGISKARELEWRFFINGSKYLSK